MPRIVLTFDDGPGPSTPALLDVLAASGVRAVFFLLGANLEQGREIAVRAAREGHVLGNHTYSHARPHAISDAQLAAEIERTDALLAGVTGDATAPLLRLPYGVVPGDPRPAVLARLGREHVGWTADFADWEPSDPQDLCARMDAHVRAQHAAGRDAIIDLHDSSRLGAERTATVAAVQGLIALHGASAFGVLP